MTTLEHKKYGTLGNEFIVHHSAYKPKRLGLSLLLTSVVAFAFQIHEVDDVKLWMMSLCLAGLLVFRLLYKVKREAVLVVPSVGVEVETEYWLGGLETHFFDRAHVKGIVINEAVTMHSILSYLAVLLTSGSSPDIQHIFPLFTRSWLGQQDLVYIYRAVEDMQLDRAKGKKPGGIGQVRPVLKSNGMKNGVQDVRRQRQRTRSSQS
ncbi:hypothetical protein ACOMHN_029644 [Nucella lapillus]